MVLNKLRPSCKTHNLKGNAHKRLFIIVDLLKCLLFALRDLQKLTCLSYSTSLKKKKQT